jgi:SAM-dependent methyltransferase
VTGVDIQRTWDPTLGADIDGFELLESSVLDLPFADNSFDLIFYYHVIEHVSDPARSLKELARVLLPGGLIYVGTPNRHRIVGYLGESVPKVTPSQKLRWNLSDYKARLRNRFRNELGAHAGFSTKELSQLLGERFTDIRFLTDDYIRFKYGGRLPRPALEFICSPPILEVAASSIYAVAQKPDTQR